MFLHQADTRRYILIKQEYQKYEKKSRTGGLATFSKQLLLCLLLSGGVIVLDIESIDIEVNFNFDKTENIEVVISQNRSI
jgi:hypothetical protein